MGHQVRGILAVARDGLRAEIAIGPLAGNRRFEPEPGLGDQLRVVEQEGHRGIATEPIGHLFPEATAFAGRIQPGIVVLVQVAAHVAHVADVARSLEFELFAGTIRSV